MTKVLVPYYSSYGHVEKLANEIAIGAGEVEGVEVVVKRVPETAPPEVVEAAHYKIDQVAPIATTEELVEYDAIIIGTGTRYGRISSQMAAFWDQTGPLFFSGAFVGKIGSAFTASGTQHGGQETTLMSMHTSFLHLGMIVVGLPYAFKGLFALDAARGGSPYGASTISGNQENPRSLDQVEIDGARFQGRHVAELAKRLFP